MDTLHESTQWQTLRELAVVYGTSRQRIAKLAKDLINMGHPIQTLRWGKSGRGGIGMLKLNAIDFKRAVVKELLVKDFPNNI